MATLQMWVVYSELYSDSESSSLTGVYIEGTYSGSEAGRVKARQFCFRKATELVGRIGGQVKFHGRDDNHCKEVRVWADRPPVSSYGLYPVYVAKLVTHNPAKTGRTARV